MNIHAIFLEIILNIEKALGIAFPKHTLILSLGGVLSEKIRFSKNNFLIFYKCKFHCKKSQITFYGNLIFQGKIIPKLKISFFFRNTLPTTL